jgi:hypothetical protein
MAWEVLGKNEKGAILSSFYPILLQTVSIHSRKLLGEQVKNILLFKKMQYIFSLEYYFMQTKLSLSLFIICWSISILFLGLFIWDYSKFRQFSINNLTAIFFTMVFILIPFAHKIKFLGIEFIRLNDPAQRKVRKNSHR